MKRTLIVTMLVLTPASALAQSDSAAAEVLYNDAMTARGKKDFAAACPKFAESYRLDPTPATLVMVGECDEKDGKLADSWAHLQEAVPKLRDSGQIAYAKKLIAGLEKRVPRLTVTLASGAPEGTIVKRDGVELRSASLGSALPVNPGEHTVVVSAPGRKNATKKVSVAEGKAAQIEVAVGEVGEAPPVPVDAKQPASKDEKPNERRGDGGGGGRKTLGYVLGGVGIVGLGVGAATGIILLGKQSDVKAANCDKGTSVCTGPNASDGVKAASSGQSLTPVYYAGLAIGVVGLAAGAYFVLSSDSDTGSSVAVRVAPTSASVEGSF